jgi:nicotinamide phosphoribosyltransferase
MSYPKEIDAYTHILNTFKTGIVSIVIDTYNTIEAAKMFTNELRELVLERDGKVVLRPDSGDPKTIAIEVLDILWEGFGGSYNSKGLKVLNPKVGLIWGDGMNLATAIEFVNHVCESGFSPENVVIGMGGGLLAKHNRDTFNFCIKPGAFDFGNGWVPAQKQSEDKMKVSLPGRVFAGNAGTLVDSPEKSIMEDLTIYEPLKPSELVYLAEAKENSQQIPEDMFFTTVRV